MRLVVVGRFVIRGRGVMISIDEQAAKDARARGDIWKLGDILRSEDRYAVITGIEAYAIKDPPQQGFLLKGVTMEDLYEGQVWELWMRTS